MMKNGAKMMILVALLILAFTTPTQAATKTVAKPKLEVAGWIPYWRAATGTAEALTHLDTFTEISPFGYTVKTDGTLFDAAKITEEPWPTLIKAAQAKKIKVIPTIMWGNATAMDTVLRSTKLRQAQIKQIVASVMEQGWDGIDIDYEAKFAKTRNYFSLFLKELYKAMGNKLVVCTIESRTPLTSRYDTIPTDITYANDYVAINKYCDRVRIMTYDQGAIDIKLNKKVEGLYVPVSDPKWVEKVINLAAQTIPKKKIFIGIPTYGYEYEFNPLAEDGFRYKMLWAFNPKYAIDLAASLGIKPERNVAGEKSFTYATSSVERVVWWSDASAIQDKVLLAKKLGVRGVAVFKIDGGADPVMWGVLKQ